MQITSVNETAVSRIVVYQACATFITEGPKAIQQVRQRAAPSFHTGCLVLVTGMKIHFVVLHLVCGQHGLSSFK